MNLMTNVYDRQKGLLRRKGGCPVMSCWSNSASVLHPTYRSYKNPGKVNQSTFSCLYFLLELGFIIHVKKKKKMYWCYSKCPEECCEAISSLVYAAARVSEVPELRDLRSLFADRYGTNSLEQFVNPEVY